MMYLVFSVNGASFDRKQRDEKKTDFSVSDDILMFALERLPGVFSSGVILCEGCSDEKRETRCKTRFMVERG